MIHVMHAIADPSMGGAAVLLRTLFSQGSSREFSLSLLAPQDALPPKALFPGATLIPLPLSSRQGLSPKDMARLLGCLRQRKPDILHTHGWFAPRLAASLLPPKDLPLRISTKHCAAQPPAFPLLYRRVTNMTVATGENAYRLLLSQGIPRRELSLFPNCPRSLTRDPAIRQKMRQRYGLSPTTVAVGLCARLAPIKGQDTLLSAAAQLRDADMHFFLLGDGPDKERLSSRICKEKLTNVQLLGEWQDPAPFYQMLDISLSCSLGSETSSLALGEGLSLSLPTLASDIPGNRLLLGDGGLFYPPGDSLSLAEALRQMCAALPRYREAAEKRYRLLPTPEGTCRLYEGLYRTLLADRRKYGERRGAKNASFPSPEKT